VIYEDLLSFWIAFLLWELIPPTLTCDVPFYLKLTLFISKEFFFFIVLAILGLRLAPAHEKFSFLFERIFLLFSFILYSLDLTLFGFKALLSPYYFSVFLVLLWFFHYYLVIKIVFYRLRPGYFRILLGLILPFMILIFLDETLAFFKIHFPGQFFLLLFVVIAFSPYFVIKFWPVERLPEGTLRDIIDKFLKQEGLSLRDYYILPRIGPRFYTAGVLGFIPPFRYLFFSSGLLEIMGLKEIFGILAHEAGHLNKRHGLYLFIVLLSFPLFLLNTLYLFLLLMSLLFSDSKGLEAFLKGPYAYFLEIGLITFLIGTSLFFLRVVFAYFLRSLEREADLYALLKIKDPEPLVSALYKLGEVTGQLYRKSWHHYGLMERILFLNYAFERPGLIRAHSVKLRRRLLLWLLGNLLGMGLFAYLGADIFEKILKIFFP
jgi:STE24 endopeptidase